MTKANESRRKDPVINEAVGRALAERRVAVSEVSVLAEKARAVMDKRPYPNSGDDYFIEKIAGAVTSLQRHIAEYERLHRGGATQTYIENISAFELGDLIATDLERAQETSKGDKE